MFRTNAAFRPSLLLSLLCFVFLLPFVLQGGESDAVSSHRDAERHYRRGVRFLLNHQLRRAEENLLQALSFDPKNGKIHWETGWVYWQKGNWERTMHHWNKTREHTPQQEDLEKFYGLAEQYAKWEEIGKRRDRVYRAATSPFRQGKEGQITIAAVGDIMMGSDYAGIERLPPFEGRTLFAGVRSGLVGDIVFGNLEGPLTDTPASTKCKEGKQCYVFRTPVRFARTLRAAGFNIVNVANNHIMDFGASGVKDTIAALSANEIAHFGHISRPRIVLETNGVKVGFLGVSTTRCCIHINQIERSEREVGRLGETADIVVVSFHAGAEGLGAAHTPQGREFFYGEDRGNVRTFAHRMIDAGADLVLGHGPHTLRGMEIYKKRAIVYSLCNFLGYLGFNTSGHLKYSMILRATIGKNGDLKEIDVVPIELNPRAMPKIDPKGRSLILLNDLSRTDFGRNGIRLQPSGRWISEPQSDIRRSTQSDGVSTKRSD